MIDKTTVELAERVSLLMQIDRTRGKTSSAVDLEALAGLPTHVARVFEEANAVSGELTPAQAYALINKRVSALQAQVYLMRLELEDRQPHDPASIYEDPLVISAYGERIAALGSSEKSFSFGPEILATGWYAMEMDGETCHRWMRPGDASLACVPHLGPQPQRLVITGYVMHAPQLDALAIRAAGREAEIKVTETAGVTRFAATLDLDAADVRAATYVPVEFTLGDDFRAPNELDTRLLGANVHGFALTPRTADSAS